MILKTLSTIKDKVYYLLRIYPKTRDNDALLYCMYLNIHHDLADKIGIENYKILKRLMVSSPFPESVRRVRQTIQSEGNFLGEKRKKRLESAANVRKNITKG